MEPIKKVDCPTSRETVPSKSKWEKSFDVNVKLRREASCSADGAEPRQHPLKNPASTDLAPSPTSESGTDEDPAPKKKAKCDTDDDRDGSL